MPHHARQGVELLARPAVPVDPGKQPIPQRRSHRGAHRRSISSCELAHALPIEVVTLVIERDRHVERVPRDDEVGRPCVDRNPIERRVRLDEPPVTLSRELRVDLVARRDQPVEPRRQRRERRRQVGRPEHQKRADHLHPRGAALRSSTDHDVAVPEREPKPPATVLVRRPVPHGRQLTHLISRRSAARRGAGGAGGRASRGAWRRRVGRGAAGDRRH
jgi:hypothetical protein